MLAAQQLFLAIALQQRRPAAWPRVAARRPIARDRHAWQALYLCHLYIIPLHGAPSPVTAYSMCIATNKQHTQAGGLEGRKALQESPFRPLPTAGGKED